MLALAARFAIGLHARNQEIYLEAGRWLVMHSSPAIWLYRFLSFVFTFITTIITIIIATFIVGMGVLVNSSHSQAGAHPVFVCLII